MRNLSLSYIMYACCDVHTNWIITPIYVHRRNHPYTDHNAPIYIGRHTVK